MSDFKNYMRKQSIVLTLSEVFGCSHLLLTVVRATLTLYLVLPLCVKLLQLLKG